MPNIFFNWPAGIVIAAEQINPVITGCEIKFTINPSLHKPTEIKIMPVKKLSVTAILGSDVTSGGTLSGLINYYGSSNMPKRILAVVVL